MTKKGKWVFIFGFSIILCFSNTLWAISPLEREILSELNAVRSNPKAYSKKISQLLSQFEGKKMTLPSGRRIVTKEGPKAVKQTVKALQKTRSVSVLMYSSGLSKAAELHVRDQGPTGKIGHRGRAGQKLTERVERYGVWKNRVGENISYGMHTAEDVIAQLLVDDGIKGRGHRKNMLDARYQMVGIACGPHQRYRVMCVLDFAGNFMEH